MRPPASVSGPTQTSLFLSLVPDRWAWVGWLLQTYCLSRLPLSTRRKVFLKGRGKREVHGRRVVAFALPLGDPVALLPGCTAGSTSRPDIVPRYLCCLQSPDLHDIYSRPLH